MTAIYLDDFLQDATSAEPGSEGGLGCEELYGLYTSWCLLHKYPISSPGVLFRALARKGIVPGRSRLAMRGPAAVDYIVASAPALA